MVIIDSDFFYLALEAIVSYLSLQVLYHGTVGSKYIRDKNAMYEGYPDLRLSDVRRSSNEASFWARHMSALSRGTQCNCEQSLHAFLFEGMVNHDPLFRRRRAVGPWIRLRHYT